MRSSLFVRRPFALCLLAFFLFGLASCTSARYFRKNLKREIEHSPVFSRSFTGFHLMDATTGRTLCAVNAGKYFTPASNTKILTLATCLKVLGDSIPGLKVIGHLLGGDEIRGGTEWVQAWLIAPTADPTFLHPRFQAWQPVYTFLKTTPVIYFSDTGRYVFERFGPGWSWDDYTGYYSTERSSFPIFGNVSTIGWTGDRWRVSPNRYQDSLVSGSDGGSKRGVWRKEYENRLLAAGISEEQLKGIEVEIPIFEMQKQQLLLLSDTLGWPLEVFETGYMPDNNAAILYSTPVDTVYRRMMYESDNFVAEQLLLVCAGVQFDTLHPEKMIAWAKDSLFAGLPDAPRWVDGSGLSRYNLLTPAFLTALLRQLYLEQPRERLFSLFPAGGASGTIADWYRGPGGKPFVFAKTGTMSGVHCLSGYLVTKKGKVLIFSFMHNNFIGSSKPWKEEMQRLLREIWLMG